MPLTLGLGFLVGIVFDQVTGKGVGAVAGAIFTAVALMLLYGFGFALRRGRRTSMPTDEVKTPPHCLLSC